MEIETRLDIVGCILNEAMKVSQDSRQAIERNLSDTLDAPKRAETEFMRQNIIEMRKIFNRSLLETSVAVISSLSTTYCFQGSIYNPTASDEESDLVNKQ